MGDFALVAAVDNQRIGVALSGNTAGKILKRCDNALVHTGIDHIVVNADKAANRLFAALARQMTGFIACHRIIHNINFVYTMIDSAIVLAHKRTHIDRIRAIDLPLQRQVLDHAGRIKLFEETSHIVSAQTTLVKSKNGMTVAVESSLITDRQRYPILGQRDIRRQSRTLCGIGFYLIAEILQLQQRANQQDIAIGCDATLAADHIGAQHRRGISHSIPRFQSDVVCSQHGGDRLAGNIAIQRQHKSRRFHCAFRHLLITVGMCTSRIPPDIIVFSCHCGRTRLTKCC